MRANFRIAAVGLLVVAGAVTAIAQNQVQIPTDPADTRIPRNSRVFIVPSGGFEQYLAAALRKKSVPLLIVTEREAADFEITTTNEQKEAGWARIIFTGIL